MTEETAAAFQREGGNAFPTESTSEDTEAASQAGDENQEGDTQSPEGDNTQGDDKTPFHEHPRWKQRESEWDKRFNDQEVRHQDDLKAIREEFGTKRTENAEATKIPVWFGGTQEQWNAYRADQERDLAVAEDRAIARLTKGREEATKAEEKAVADATTYLRSELSAIESDKTLNPSGAKIEAEKLLKVVLDNQLIDTQGRWNYRAGWKILTGTTVAPAPKPKPVVSSEKKNLAEATNEEGARGEDKSKTYKTSADFKKDRPW